MLLPINSTDLRYSDHSSGTLHYLELTELAARIRTRQVSPVEVLRAQLDRIATLDHTLHSYALVMADAAMAQAETAQAEIAAGRYRGPLHGVPIAVKDLCFTAGFATEGAYSDHHPSITPPCNPWHADHWPGMSSSGSGVATAAGLCYGALGSDTGGSIRFPCAANGLTGIKPSWGRVSRHGVFELAASLDHIGPMARSAVDAGVLLGVIAGSDENDPTAALDPVPDYLATADRGVRGLRIGIDAAWNSNGVDAATQAMLKDAAETLRALGARLVDLHFPDVTQAVADWFPLCAAEAAVAHEATYPSRKTAYGPVLASVIEAGLSVSGTDLQKIRLRRMALRGRISALFAGIDLLLIPVHPFASPTVAAMRTLGETPALVSALLRYTAPFDMTGHPTITLPGGFTDAGMPLAFQLVAAHMNEPTLVSAGAAFQSVTTWHHRHPLD